MKPVRLARIALQAERVRFSHMIRRLLVQAGLIAAGLAMLLVGFAFGELALFHLLEHWLPPAGAAGSVAGADLLLALILIWIATAMGPGSSEREAALVSTEAREGIRQSLNWAQYLNWRTLLWVFELVRARRR